jgi:hypothetical protein
MKVLVACEESQTVCKAFRAKGHEAYSCDIVPCSGGHPEWHIQKDVTSIIYDSNLRKNYDKEGYDLVISFPPCTHLSGSGARWFDKKRLSGEQEAAIEFFFHIWFYSHCTENPVGIVNSKKYIKKWFPKLYAKMMANNFPFKPSQIIQPWGFGHLETKKTCLWLNDIPALKQTNNVYYEMMKLPYGQRAKVHHASPGPERAKIRSKTYEGVAAAMADQWSLYLNFTK